MYILSKRFFSTSHFQRLYILTAYGGTDFRHFPDFCVGASTLKFIIVHLTLLTSQHILQLTECVKIKDYIFQLHMHTRNQYAFKKKLLQPNFEKSRFFFPQAKLKEWKTHVYLTFPDINQIWTTDLQTSFAKTRRSNGWLLSKLLTSKGLHKLLIELSRHLLLCCTRETTW